MFFYSSIEIQILEYIKDSITGVYFKQYMLGPYLTGQALTLATVIRRVMLEEVEGLAIICLRISELFHEFSSIPNVQDDILEVTLNLTSVVLAGQKPNQSFIVTLYAKGPKVITANDIIVPKGIYIANPYHYITTVNDYNTIGIDLVVGKGKGSVLSEEIALMVPSEWSGYEYIVPDAAFAPVIKINFFVSSAGKKAADGWETLMLEIWTNGSLSLSYAFKAATRILKSTFFILQNIT